MPSRTVYFPEDVYWPLKKAVENNEYDNFSNAVVDQLEVQE